MSCGNGSCTCGSNCGCGSSCSCGKRNLDLGISEESTTHVSVIAGFAPPKTYFEESEMMSCGAENGGCKCGTNCACGSSCKCGK